MGGFPGMKRQFSLPDITKQQVVAEKVRSHRRVPLAITDKQIEKFFAGRGEIKLGSNESLTALNNNYVATARKSYNIIGKLATTPQDHASLFASLRSPLVERFFWHITDAEGNVLGSGIHAMGAVDGVHAPNEEELAHIFTRAESMGAKEVHFAHNHVARRRGKRPARCPITSRAPSNLRLGERPRPKSWRRLSASPTGTA